MPKILRTGFGSPTGMCAYEGSLLPSQYQGQLLHTDAGPRHVRSYHLTVLAGAGYGIEREDMVQSSDNWFRPSDVCVAPDGSVFVADWYDPGVGGHGMGDTARGRIFRLAPKGNKPLVPTIDLSSGEGILAALGSPALSVRYLAMAELGRLERGKALAILAPAGLQKTNPVLRARTLWQLARLGGLAADSLVLKDALTDDDMRIMQLGVRLASTYLHYTPEQFTRYLGTWDGKDNVPGNCLWREVLIAARNQDPKSAKDLIYKLMGLYAEKDRYYLEAIGIAVGNQDQKRKEIILSDFDKVFPEWNERVGDLVWALQPPQVLHRLQKQLLDQGLSDEQKIRIIDILTGSKDAAVAKGLLTILQRPLSDEVRENVLLRLRQFLPGKWREVRASPELKEAVQHLLDQPRMRASGLILAAASADPASIPRIRTIAIDEQEPMPSRLEALRALGQIPSMDAVKGLQALLTTPNATIAAAAVEALGAQVPMWRENEISKAAVEPLKRVVLDKQANPLLRQKAAVTLANTRPGAFFILYLQTRKQLPDVLRPDVARVLRNSPFEDIRNRAVAAFPASTRLDPKRLPTLVALASRRGDAARGKELLAASAKNDMQCLKCHTIAGVGGQIGPDLSVIGQKASRENLFESILYPNKAIADQYVTWVVTTNNGLVLTGLIIEDKPDHVLLRDANNKDTRIEVKDIDTRAKSPNSLMPNDLLAYMTEDDLVDMVEYLLSLK